VEKEKNQRFTSFNQLNERVYLSGVDGGWIFMFLGIIIAVSFAISIVVFGQPLPALGITVILISGLFRFLKRYKRIYRENGLDDPIERELEVNKLTKVYRDNDNLLA